MIQQSQDMSYLDSDNVIPSLVNLLSSLTEMKFNDDNSVPTTTPDYMIESDVNESFYDNSLITDSDPMLNSTNFIIKRLDISAWRDKAVDQWTKEDVLFWVSDECERAGLFILDADMPNLCSLTGQDLVSMTLEDFLNKITNESFARRLYNRLQSILNPNNCSDIENDVLTTLRTIPLNDSVNCNNNSLCSKYGCENSFSTNSNDSTMKLDIDSGVESCSDSEQCFDSFQQSLSDDMWNDYNAFFNSNVANNNKNSVDLNSNSNNGSTNEWSSWPAQSDCSSSDISCNSVRSEGNKEFSNTNKFNSECMVPEDEPKQLESTAPVKRRPGRPRGIRKKKPEKIGLLWEFLRDLLHNPKYNPSVICWDDYKIGKFKFMSSEKVAQMWGLKRENSLMTFDKFSRAMRYHYKSNTLIAVQKRLVYQFGENATGWRTPNPIIL